MDLNDLTIDELNALDAHYKEQQDKFFGCGITGDFADREFKEAQFQRERIWTELRERRGTVVAAPNIARAPAERGENMKRCFSLAFSVPNDVHVRVRVFGHGTLLGELCLRNEERACFEALFYDTTQVVCHKLRASERAGGMSTAQTGKETSSCFGFVGAGE